MRLFDKHSKENEEKAKSALNTVVARTIGKYIVCQELLNSYLAGGGPKTKGKEESCLCCIIDKLTSKMAKLEVQVGQIIKTHEELFGTDLDIQSITNGAFEEFYPTRTGSKNRKSKVDMPESTPEEVQDLVGVITKAVGKFKGKNFDVRVIDANSTSLKPSDFDSIEDYYKAVKARLKQMEGKNGEEIINDAIINKAEEKTSSNGVDKSKKGNDKPSDDKSKLN